MKILMLGDSPFIKTGFGVVNSIVYQTLLDEGHELIIIGGQDGETHEHPDTVKFVPVPQSPDMLGWTKVPDVIEAYKPEAVHIMGDAAMTSTWLIHEGVRALPTLAYVPIEGAPLNMIWVNSFKAAPRLSLVTCTNYGVEVLASDGVPARMAYHGVSSDFHPLTQEGRADLRARLGWEDKFIVMCVAQNVRRKQWPRLFDAIRLLSKRHPEVILYAHTVPFNNYWLDGHDLTQIAGRMGISDKVYFPPSHTKHNAAIDVRGLDMPGLADLYGIADCFVLPSQVEGFGLPLAEAMASGLPVITTNYAAQREVVWNAGILVEPIDWEWNKSGAIYANLDPRDIASAIERLIKSVELRKRYARAGIERAKDFRWDDYQNIVREFFRGGFSTQEEAYEVHQVDEVNREAAAEAVA